ncbi:uncharacterized protein KY384_002067 [Bacidia gigantensis]|uniref:uncharacterized protein n=1 Tax=Bacidia gigantensis TaxID=2732470 RepID=UPI001D05AE7B|nr:uncharacterized protein KY384_002067 [Bacidia gigantensis]KAG8533284.1 hypothetical protein KY384_002067 [Bacidia gigantensis]
MSTTPPASFPPLPPHSLSATSYGAPIIDDDREKLESAPSIDPALGGEKQGGDSDGGATDGRYGQRPQSTRRIKIEELLCIDGVPPPPPAAPSILSDENRQELKTIYNTAYAPGMDKFLDTHWFSERGCDHLMANSVLCDQFTMLIHRYAMNSQDPVFSAQLAITKSLEAMVVWSMLCLCRKVAQTTTESGEVNEDEVKDGVVDAAKRLEIFEALITGDYRSDDSAPQGPDGSKPNGSALLGQLKSKEYEFWRSIHAFLTIKRENENSAEAIESTLATTRSLLENRENRDVIYSMMIARHLGGQVPGFPDSMQAPETNDEKDVHAKLAVARRLLEEESAGKGTNQVVLRLCGAACRSWSVKR